MLGIVKSIRLPECVLVVLLSYLSFLFANISVNIFTLTTLFFVVAATMLQNDWRDRFHDRSKGKMFPSEHPKIFLTFVTIFWIICFTLVLLLTLYENLMTGSMMLAMAAVGLLYSEARCVPLLSVSLVTATVSGASLLVLGYGAKFSDVFPLFLTVAFIMFGRETLHDIGDIQVDTGYKKTVAIVFGHTWARIVSLISLTAGAVIAVSISLINIPGALGVLWGLTGIFTDEKVLQVRKKVDIGLLLLLLGFLLSVASV